MSIKTKNLCPGDKVHIPKDIMFYIDDVAYVIAATKGSIGIVLSYEEYSDFIHKTNQGDCTAHLAWVKSQIEAESMHPIRIEKFVPYEYDETPPLFVECHVGYITFLNTEWLEKIEETHSQTK